LQRPQRHEANNATLIQNERSPTHLSAGLDQKYKRLEHLSNFMLWLTATAFINRQHSLLNVGACSNPRAQPLSGR
ncbi:ribonuclease III, partial [Synechococcus sp. AH-603-M21]|nr:ribonuclease III [Synechococcus sp. AH-603-M21]